METPKDQLAVALSALVTPFAIALLQDLAGVELGGKEPGSDLVPDVVKCQGGHICERLIEVPPSYGGSVYCNRCSDPDIHATWGHWFQCSACLFDVCPRCATGDFIPVGATSTWLSPLSVGMCLAMVARGAEQGSVAHEEFRKALGHTALGHDNVVAAACVRVADALTMTGTGVRLAVASSAWVKGPVHAQYLAEIQAIFGADAKPMPGGPGPVNDWVAEMTEGKITEILDELNPDDRVVLVNAIYFKGTWKTQFKKEATRKKDFQRLQGPVSCQMMSLNEKNILYTEIDLSGSGDSWVQACRLPYDNSSMSAVVVLPKSWGSSAISRLLSAFTGPRWEALSKSFAEQHVALELPKFTLDSGLLDMKATLVRLGIRTAWEKPSFPVMSDDPLRLSKVLHRAVCEVNEEGTVAAAATAAVMTKGGKRPLASEPIKMEVDRPFIFAIVHNLGAAPLFWGVVASPSTQVGSSDHPKYPEPRAAGKGKPPPPPPASKGKGKHMPGNASDFDAKFLAKWKRSHEVDYR